MASAMEPAVRAQAQRSIEEARKAAIKKHGELKGGLRRWIHHLEEECQEAVDEMRAMDFNHSPSKEWEIRVKLIAELAQVAQLAQTMMVLLYMKKEKEGEETWKPDDLNIYSDPEPPIKL